MNEQDQLQHEQNLAKKALALEEAASSNEDR